MTQHLGSVMMEPKRNEWTCAVLTLRRGPNLLLFSSKDRLSHVHSYANGFIPQKGASSEPGYKEILPNTHTHTHTEQNMSQALKQSGIASGALAFIYFMNSCATQGKATREGFGFVYGPTVQAKHKFGVQSGEPALI